MNRKGLSLVELLVSIAVSTIVLYAGVSAILGAEHNFSSFLNASEKNSDHNLKINSLINSDKLRFMVSLMPTSIQQCLRQKGQSCQKYSSKYEYSLNSSDIAGLGLGKDFCLGGINGAISNCNVIANISLSLNCNHSVRCSDLIVDLTSFDVKLKKEIKSRYTVPYFLLLDRMEIDFSCTNSSFLKSIDFENLRANCANPSFSMVSLSMSPIKTIGPGFEHIPATTSCKDGISNLNVYGDKSKCDSSPPSGCNPAESKKAIDLAFTVLTSSSADVAQNCIDAVNPTLSDNLPTDAIKKIRFKNTCGNRYCIGKGYLSGRVVEMSGGSLSLLCQKNLDPNLFSPQCSQILLQQVLFQNLSLPQKDVQAECIDSIHPTVDSNDPSLSSAHSSRFYQTCGQRSCLNRGYRDGRVTENSFGNLTLECVNDPIEAFTDLTVTMDLVAQNCIDSVNPTIMDNLPNANSDAHERFLNTCGHRYCIAQGKRTGYVREFNNGQSTVRCIR